MLAQNTIYRLINVVIVFLITMIVSRALGVGGYGILSLLIVNATVFNLITSLGADAGVTYHSAAATIRRAQILRVIWIIILTQIILLSLVELFWFQYYGHSWLLDSVSMEQLAAGVLFVISISITEKYTALLNGYQLFTLSSRVTLFTNILTLLIFVFAKNIYPAISLTGYLWLYILLSLLQSLVLLISWHLSHKPTNISSPPQALKAFFSYSLIAFVTNSIQFLAYRIDYWFLDYYRGEMELGWYSLAVKLVQSFWILPLVFAGILLPQVAASGGAQQRDRVLLLTRVVNLVNLAGAVLFLLIGNRIVPLLFGSSYTPSVNLMLILLPGIILFGIATIFAAYFAGVNKLKVNFIASTLCLLTIGVLDLILIPRWGMKGAAIASSIGYSLTAIYYLVQFRIEHHYQLSKILVPGKQDWETVMRLLPAFLTKKNA